MMTFDREHAACRLSGGFFRNLSRGLFVACKFQTLKRKTQREISNQGASKTGGVTGILSGW